MRAQCLRVFKGHIPKIRDKKRLGRKLSPAAELGQETLIDHSLGGGVLVHNHKAAFFFGDDINGFELAKGAGQRFGAGFNLSA